MRAWCELALVALIAACDHAAPATTTAPPASTPATVASASAAPSASTSASVRPECVVDAARIADVRAKVKTLKPGMTHVDVDRVLGLDWTCFGGGGTGGADGFMSGSVLAPGVQINLGWQRRGDAGFVLTTASVTP